MLAPLNCQKRKGHDIFWLVYLAFCSYLELFRHFKVIRCFCIVAVCTCIVITGLCYLLTEQLTNFYVVHRLHEGSRVIVEFDIGFYMITAAGVVSVIAVGSTLMHVHNPSSSAVRGWSHGSVLESTHQRRDPQLVDADACLLVQPAASAYPPAARAPPPYRP